QLDTTLSDPEAAEDVAVMPSNAENDPKITMSSSGGGAPLLAGSGEVGPGRMPRGFTDAVELAVADHGEENAGQLAGHRDVGLGLLAAASDDDALADTLLGRIAAAQAASRLA